MYAEKASGRLVHSQTQSVLMQLLTEREPTLRSHLCDVGTLADGHRRDRDEQCAHQATGQIERTGTQCPTYRVGSRLPRRGPHLGSLRRSRCLRTQRPECCCVWQAASSRAAERRSSRQPQRSQRWQRGAPFAEWLQADPSAHVHLPNRPPRGWRYWARRPDRGRRSSPDRSIRSARQSRRLRGVPLRARGAESCPLDASA